MPEARTLIAADLHFEKGSSRGAKGVHLPPYDTRATLRALGHAVARWRPERLVLLGDSFHDERGPGRLDEADIASIGGLGRATEIIWITGNHDPVIAADLPGTVADEMWLGNLVLRHAPRAGAAGEIAGHLHPVAAVVRRGRKLRCRCFAGDGGRLILPAFGAYAGGLSVLATPFAPLFSGRQFTAWLIGRSAIHRIPATGLA
jgi:DNA ligase-associated metallophosphoesterase